MYSGEVATVLYFTDRVGETSIGQCFPDGQLTDFNCLPVSELQETCHAVQHGWLQLSL